MEEQIEKSGLWPQSEFGIIDIEDFVGSRLEVDLDMYHQLPDDIMGEAVFTYNKQTRIHINRDLTGMAEDATARWNAARWMIGRWRMTIAHEAAHVILHEPIIFPKATDGTPLTTDPSKTYRCHKKNLSFMGASATKDECSLEFAKNATWKKAMFVGEDQQTLELERQANCAAAALLMPRSRFITAANEYFTFINESYPKQPEKARRWRVYVDLADRFKVSGQAAFFRCETLKESIQS